MCHPRRRILKGLRWHRKGWLCRNVNHPQNVPENDRRALEEAHWLKAAFLFKMLFLNRLPVIIIIILIVLGCILETKHMKYKLSDATLQCPCLFHQASGLKKKMDCILYALALDSQFRKKGFKYKSPISTGGFKLKNCYR